MVGRSLRSRNTKSKGQRGLVFQGCTKVHKNTEKYYKNMFEVKLGSVLLGGTSWVLGGARGISPKGFGNFKSKGVEWDGVRSRYLN